MGWQDWLNGGEAENPLDAFPMKKAGQPGQQGGGGESKFAYQQPATVTPPPVLTPLSMPPQQQALEPEQAPGWGFLRAYLGK
jgi:hypothetical protein